MSGGVREPRLIRASRSRLSPLVLIVFLILGASLRGAPLTNRAPRRDALQFHESGHPPHRKSTTVVP